MGSTEADKKADFAAVSDRGENVSAMMPLLIGEGCPQRGELIDLALDLAARSAGFRRSLPGELAEEEVRIGQLPPRSGNLLEAVLYRGELPRSEVAAAVATGDRQARRVVAALLEKGVLVSESPRAALRLTFPAALASRWMPGLFPEQAG